MMSALCDDRVTANTFSIVQLYQNGFMTDMNLEVEIFSTLTNDVR